MTKQGTSKTNAYDLGQVSRALSNKSGTVVTHSTGSGYDLNRVNAAKTAQKPGPPRPVKR